MLARVTFVLMLLAISVVAAPVPKALKPKRPSVEGSWQLVELNLNGQDYTKLNLQEWLITNGAVTMIRLDGGRRTVVKDCGPFRLTATGNAEEVDWVSDEHDPPTSSPAIVRVSDDELLLVIARPNAPRPTEFKSGAQVSLYRFERLQK